MQAFHVTDLQELSQASLFHDPRQLAPLRLRVAKFIWRRRTSSLHDHNLHLEDLQHSVQSASL